MAENFGMRFMQSRYMLPKQLTHLVCYGMTGSGKSQTINSLISRVMMRGNIKVFDLYSSGAGEGFYWSLPSNHKFWKDRQFSYKNQKTAAREFPVRCLVPMCKNMPDELPDICKPFTIPITSLTENDLKAMLGNNLTKNEIALWRKIRDNFKNTTTHTDLTNMMIDAQKSEDERTPGIHGTGVSSLYNMFSSFEPHKLFSSGNNKLSLDIAKELRDKKVITSLILKFFPDELWPFIVNHFIYQINQIMTRENTKTVVILIIREAGDFLSPIGESSPQEDAVRSNMAQVLKKGRKHQLYFWMDNQTGLNVEAVKTQFGIKICHKVTNTIELQNALGDLGALLLTKNDYNLIRTFKPGKCFVLEENRGLFNPQMFPPLTRMSGEEGADFIEIWRSEKGERFKNTKVEVEPINVEFKESLEKWKELLSKRKEAKKLRKLASKKTPLARKEDIIISQDAETEQEMVVRTPRKQRKEPIWFD